MPTSGARLSTILGPPALALTLVAAAPAHAADVSVAGGVVTFAAAAGEANDVTVTDGLPGTIVLVDGGPGHGVAGAPVALRAGTGCLRNPAGGVTCSGAKAIDINLGDGADRARLQSL